MSRNYLNIKVNLLLSEHKGKIATFVSVTVGDKKSMSFSQQVTKAKVKNY